MWLPATPMPLTCAQVEGLHSQKRQQLAVRLARWGTASHGSTHTIVYSPPALVIKQSDTVPTRHLATTVPVNTMLNLTSNIERH
jgi:hypothetical protein